MSKNYLIFIIGSLIVIYMIVVASLGVMYEKAINQIEKQDVKIELLQLENASLHDDIWNLNQELMKEDAE